MLVSQAYDWHSSPSQHQRHQHDCQSHQRHARDRPLPQHLVQPSERETHDTGEARCARHHDTLRYPRRERAAIDCRRAKDLSPARHPTRHGQNADQSVAPAKVSAIDPSMTPR